MKDILVNHSENCRRRQMQHELDSLVDSLSEYGMMSPIVVAPMADAEKPYKLIQGFRRYEAWRRLKQEQIRAYVVPDKNQHILRVLNLIENIERKPLTILEEAEALFELYPEETPLKHIARELNKTFYWVKARQILLTMDDRIKEAAAAGHLSENDIMLLSEQTGGDRLAMLQQMLKRKKRKRKQQGRRPKRIKEMMVKMCEASIIGLAPRSLAWASGIISDEEFKKDIAALAEKYKTLELESEV